MSWQQSFNNKDSGGGGDWSEFQSGPPTGVTPFQSSSFQTPGGFNQQQQQWFPAGSGQQYAGGGGAFTNQMTQVPGGFGMAHYGNSGIHTPGMGMGPGNQQVPGMGMGPGNQQVPGMGMGPGNQQVPGMGMGPGNRQVPGMGMGPGNQQVPGMGMGPGNQQVPGMGPGNQMFPYQTHQGPGTKTSVSQSETPEQRRIRLEKEQQMKREDEIRKRKLMNVKISKGQSDTSSIAIESLIGFDPKAVKATATPPSARATPSTSRATPPNSIKQEQSPVVATSTTSQQSSLKEPSAPPPAKPTSDESKPPVSVTSYEDMLSGTLMDLSKTVSNTVRRSDFKKPSSNSASTLQYQENTITFTESNKAHQWVGSGGNQGGGAFEGLFAQHVPPTQQLNSGEDDGFGEFQGGDIVPQVPHPSQHQQKLHNVQPHPSLVPSGGVQGLSPIPPQPSLVPGGLSPIPPQPSLVPGGLSPVPPQPSLVPGGLSPIPSHVTHPQAQSPQVVHTSSFNNPVMMTTPQITLPHWVTSRTYFLPNIYTDVIKKCSQADANDLMSTAILFPILSSSGVDRAVLRDMWSEVNKSIPGSLTRDELVCLLAMIGILQGGDKESVSVSDLSTLLVPPPVTMATDGSKTSSNTSPDVNSVKDQQQDLTVSHTPCVSENDPYAVFRSMEPTSTDSLSPAPLPSSDETNQSDPYAAFKVLASSSSSDASSTTTPTFVSYAPPTNTSLLLNSQPISSSNSNADVSGWSDFTGLPRPPTSNQSDVFGEFSGVMTSSSSGSHGNDWANFKSENISFNTTPPTLAADDLFGNFTGGAPVATVSMTTPSMNATPLIPSTTPGIDATPLIPAATPLENTQSPSLNYKVKAVEHFEIWRTCLVRCDELLDECVSVLCAESVNQLLLEEISAYPGILDRLLGVVELYRFAERIHFASRGPGRKHMTPEKSQSLMTLMMGIKKKWNKLCDTMPNNKMTKLLKSSASSPASSSTHSDDDKCCLCLLSSNISISSLFTIDGYNEHYTLPITTGIPTGTSTDKVFHVQCMEFWIKGVHRDIAAIP